MLLQARLWRLNDAQITSAIKALIPGATIPPIQTPGRLPHEFISWDDQFPVQEGFASQLTDAAFNIAAQVGKNVSLVATCASGQADGDCAVAFIDRFVTRAFRRPLQTEERGELLALYSAGVASGTGFASGIEQVVAATLSAPSFLYRTELGAAGGTPGQPVALTPHELASSLSFTLQGGPPDDELWARAQDGTLTTPSVLALQVDRLMRQPAVRDNLTQLVLSWLDVPNVLELEKTTEDLDGLAFDTPVRQSLFDESTRFVDDVLWNGGTLSDLFSSRRAFLDARTASLYGVSASGGGMVDLSSARAGILTRAGLIASLRYGQNPEVFRGRLVRERVLCGVLADPPPSVNTSQFNAQYAGLSTKQRIALRAAQPTCGACHGLMDNLGVAFDNFGAVGQQVTKVNAVAPDPSGALTGTDVDGAFADLVGLSQKLGHSKVVAQCLVDQMMTYAFGRIADQRTCLRDQIAAQVTAAGGKLPDVFRGIVLSSLFTKRIAGSIQ